MINFAFLTKILSIKAFKDMLLNRVLGAFNTSFRQTNESFGYDSKPNPEVINYLKQREIILSKKTMVRLNGNLQFELLEGINQKESVTELTKRIEPLFDNMKTWEIERIARTETLNAMSAGEFHSQIQGGVAKWKVWKANINNKRTGSDSLRLHNQIVKITDEFIDYKTGDTCQHSPNRPNCRCTILYLYQKPLNIIKKHGLEYIG